MTTMHPLVRFGRRVGRDTGVYAVGFGITLLIALISVAILTRYLSPAEFGELAILLFFAALLTVFYNLGFLQGSLAWVFGSAGEEEADDEIAREGPVDKRQALGGAITLTTLIATGGTVLAVAAAAPLTSVLGLPGASEEVRIAAISGGLGSIWRLVSNVPRLERRPGIFALLSAVRPVLVLGITVPLVASGEGVTGAITGVALGTAASVPIGLLAIHKSFRPALPPGDIQAILAIGAPFVPVIVAFWTIQNVDLYVLSKYVSEDEVGLYRLASRVAVVISYFVSAFLMAWGPLTATATFMAAAKGTGYVGVGSRLVTYYAISGLWLLVVLIAGADLLVRIAPPAYGAAADLIPVLGASFLTYGALIVVYRAARFPRRRQAYAVWAVISSVAFVALALLLTPLLGAFGPPLAAIAAFSLGIVGFGRASQLGPSPIPLQFTRIFGAAALAFGAAATVRVTSVLPDTERTAIDIVIVLLYPALIVLFGILPTHHLKPLLQMGRSYLPGGDEDKVIGERIRGLDPIDQNFLRAHLVNPHSISDLAARCSMSERQVSQRLTTVIGKLAGLEEEAADPEIAHYLVARTPIAQRDAMARAFWEQGVDPEVIDILERTYEHLRTFAAKEKAGIV